MPRIRRHLDKVAWSDTMNDLIALRQTGSIGDVIDFIAAQQHMRLPSAVVEREQSSPKLAVSRLRANLVALRNCASCELFPISSL